MDVSFLVTANYPISLAVPVLWSPCKEPVAKGYLYTAPTKEDTYTDVYPLLYVGVSG